MIARPFRPFAFLPGGHLQTVGGYLLRARLKWHFPAEDVVLEGEEGVRILLRVTAQPDPRSPALLLVHGLEGCDTASYMVSTGGLAWQSGWSVVRMNMRGCGDALGLCARLYHAGLTTDLLAAMRWLALRFPRIGVLGFSLGGNLTLLTLAREGSQVPDEVRAAAAICPPLDMSECADAIARPSNWIYHRRFVRSLVGSYRARQRLLPGMYQAGRERGVSTVRGFDDAITAFYGGFRDAEDYYRQVSPGPRLGAIDRPVLVLGTADDPFIPASAVASWPRSDAVSVEVLETGGHVGFAGPSIAPGSFWAAERALAFLESAVCG